MRGVLDMRNMFEYASAFQWTLCWALNPDVQTNGIFRGSDGSLVPTKPSLPGPWSPGPGTAPQTPPPPQPSQAEVFAKVYAL